MLVYCGHCGTLHRLPDTNLEGDTIPCRFCGKKLPLPSVAPEAAQIRLLCPRCDGRLRTPLLAGHSRFKCPYCMERVTVPTLREIIRRNSLLHLQPPPDAGAPAKDDPDIAFECAVCGMRLAAAAKSAGMKTNCPSCDVTLTIPRKSTTVAPPPKKEPQPAAPEGDGMLLEEPHSDDAMDRYDIRRILAAHAEDVDIELVRVAEAAGAACLIALSVCLLFLVRAVHTGITSSWSHAMPFAIALVAVSLLLFLASHIFRNQCGPWRASLRALVILIALFLSPPLLYTLLAFLGVPLDIGLTAPFTWGEQLLVLIVGTGALLGCLHLSEKVRTLLFVRENFGSNSGLVDCTPWEVQNRIRAGLSLAVGREDVPRIGAGILLVVVAAVLLRNRELRLLAIVLVPAGLLLVSSGLSAMRLRRSILDACAEVLPARKGIHMLKLRAATGATLAQLSRIIDSVRRSGILPDRLLVASSQRS